MPYPTTIIIPIITLAIGAIIGYAVAKHQYKKVGANEKQKKDNLKKLEKYITENSPGIRQAGRITNNDVEKILGVGNTTAWRYLDELEKQGKIKQQGKEGKYTYYEKI